MIVASTLLTFDPKLYINGDNVDYMRLAEAARHGSLWASGKYPPVFPWLLLLPQALFGLTLLPQKIWVDLIYVASALLMLRRARAEFPRGWGEPVAWIAMTLIPVLEYGHYVMSEIPYLLFSLLALEAFERAGERGARWIAGAALAAAATFYTRSVGLSLWAGLALALLLRGPAGRRRLLGFAALSIVLLLPWGLRSFLGPPNPYFRQLVQVNPFHPEWGILDAAGWARRIGGNMKVYLGGEIPTGLLPILFRWTYDPPELRYHFLSPFLAWIPLCLAGIGLVQSLRRREPVGFYVVLYLILNLLWPTLWTGLRFLVPILPLLALLLFRGLLWLLGMTGGRWPSRPRLAAAALAIWLVLGVKNQSTMAAEVKRYPENWDAYFRAAEWIRTHTDSKDRIVDRKPAMLTYVSGREAVSFPREEDPGKMLAWMEGERISYVVVAPIPYDDVQRYLIPAVQAEQAHFAPVFEIEEPYTVVLRLKP